MTYLFMGLGALAFLMLVFQTRRYLRLKNDYDKLDCGLLRLGRAIEDGADTEAKIKHSRACYLVYRETDGIEIPIKPFYYSNAPGDMVYARLCAEELVEKLNEKP